jgi:hypothetical protein
MKGWFQVPDTPSPAEARSCKRCKKQFPRDLTWFGRCAKNPDGLNDTCRKCYGKLKRAGKVRIPPKLLKAMGVWRYRQKSARVGI